MDKADVARRQLGTALDIFLRGRDPVSVHCLAMGGGEIAEWLAETKGAEAFITHVKKTFPHLTDPEIKGLRTKHWNAFKHARKQNGKDRNDEVILSDFDLTHNEHALFWGWTDYGAAGFPFPIEAQVFEVWYLAKYLEKVSPDVDATSIQSVFPGLAQLNIAQQLLRLNDRIRKTRKRSIIMNDAKTDRRPLLL